MVESLPIWIPPCSAPFSTWPGARVLDAVHNACLRLALTRDVDAARDLLKEAESILASADAPPIVCRCPGDLAAALGWCGRKAGSWAQTALQFVASFPWPYRLHDSENPLTKILSDELIALLPAHVRRRAHAALGVIDAVASLARQDMWYGWRAAATRIRRHYLRFELHDLTKLVRDSSVAEIAQASRPSGARLLGEYRASGVPSLGVVLLWAELAELLPRRPYIKGPAAADTVCAVEAVHHTAVLARDVLGCSPLHSLGCPWSLTQIRRSSKNATYDASVMP